MVVAVAVVLVVVVVVVMTNYYPVCLLQLSKLPVWRVSSGSLSLRAAQLEEITAPLSERQQLAPGPAQRRRGWPQLSTQWQLPVTVASS